MSQTQRSRRLVSTGSFGAVVAAVVALVMVIAPTLPDESLAARRDSWPPSDMTAGAAGGLGFRVATVDLRSSDTSRRQIVFRKRLTPGRHTIEVRTLGSAHKPRTGARVDIDGFLVIGP